MTFPTTFQSLEAKASVLRSLLLVRLFFIYMAACKKAPHTPSVDVSVAMQQLRAHVRGCLNLEDFPKSVCIHEYISVCPHQCACQTVFVFGANFALF